MGRQDLFPVAVFGILLVAALAAIIAINLGAGPLRLDDTANAVGQAYGTGDTIPSGYAPPYDPNFLEQYLFASASATDTGMKLDVRVTKIDGVETQYIYKTGKYSKAATGGTAWQDFTFDTATVDGKWIANEATFSGAVSNLPSDEAYVIVYVCKRYTADFTRTWICGPKGIGGGSKNWTIQSFTPPAPLPACTAKAYQFCDTANSTPIPSSANKTINSSATCASGICYACKDGYVNSSKSCILPSSCDTGNTCTGAGTRCTLDGKVQSCDNGCWTTPTGCTGTGTTCFDTQCTSAIPTACTLKAGQACGPSPTPTNWTANNTGMCTGTNTCYRCADGYAYSTAAKTCLFSCTTSNCPSPKVCDNTAKTCAEPPVAGCAGCKIGTECIANGTVNTANSCQLCDNTSSTTAWTAKQPVCPAASTVTCGTAITPSNGCGTCSGNGTKCDAGKTCNTTTWQCTTACTPKTQAQACGTNNCGTVSDGCSGTITCGTCTAPATCSSTTAGTPGTCQTACTNECTTNGAKECSGNGYRTCGNHDSDSCLEWSTVTSCGTQTCSNGQCQTACTPTCTSSDVGKKFCFTAGVGPGDKNPTGNTYWTCQSVNGCLKKVETKCPDATPLCVDTNSAGSAQCTTPACKYTDATPTPVGAVGNDQYCTGCSTTGTLGTTLTAAKYYTGGVSGATTEYKDTNNHYFGSCCDSGSCAGTNGDCYSNGQLMQGSSWYICTNGAFAVCNQGDGQWAASRQEVVGEYWCPWSGDADRKTGWTKSCGGDGQVPCDGDICRTGLGKCDNKCITQSACAARFASGQPATCGGHGEWVCGGTPQCAGTMVACNYLCWNSCSAG